MTELDKIPFSLPFDWNRYLGDCSRHGLTPEQQGAYMKLICTFWGNRCKPLVDDQELMARITGFTVDRWDRKIRPGLVRLFVISGEGWSHEWIEEQWNKTIQKISVKSANGKQGGRGHSKKPAGSFANPLQGISQEIPQSQTANSLINMQMVKATGYAEVKLNESTYTYTYKKEESKKEPPLSPPMGGMGLGVQNDVPPSQTEQQVLFVAQEVQHAPVRETAGPRRKRNGSHSVTSSPEIEAAFVEFKAAYPRRNHPHTWTLAKPLFVEAMNSGVPGETLIHTATMYAREMKSEGKVGTSVVADARTWLNQRRWENYADFQPVSPPKTHGNVTSLRNGYQGNSRNEPVEQPGAANRKFLVY